MFQPETTRSILDVSLCGHVNSLRTSSRNMYISTTTSSLWYFIYVYLTSQRSGVRWIGDRLPCTGDPFNHILALLKKTAVNAELCSDKHRYDEAQ